MSEIELKFHMPADQRGALRAAFMDREATRSHLLARYFDSPDGALAHRGVSLRVRREDTDWVQTLKVREGNLVGRLEHNVPIAPSSAGEPAPDITRHVGAEGYGKLVDALATPAGKTGAGLVLREVHRTDIVRHVLSLRHGNATVEVAMDVGHVEAAGKTQVVSEIEFELKHGTPTDLVAIALPWVERHGLWLDVVAKGERGQLLAQGRTHAPPARSARPEAISGEPRQFVRSVVAMCLAQVLRNGSELAGGSDDPDHVHQMRVGLRRLRTALRELPQLNACLDPSWETALAGAFRELGRHRDQTLLERETGKSLTQAGAPRLRHPPREGPSITPGELVRSWSLQSTLLALLGFSLAPTEPAATAYEGDAIDAIASRLDQLQRRIRKNAKRFAEMPPEDQHAVRKRLKRLRYLAEFVAPAFRRSKASAYFEHLKPAQDALGVHNDEASALAHFRAQTSLDPHAWFAVGWLTARQPGSARASAEALRAAGRAKPFWHDKSARRKDRGGPHR